MGLNRDSQLVLGARTFFLVEGRYHSFGHMFIFWRDVTFVL